MTVENMSDSTVNISGYDPSEAYYFHVFDTGGQEVWQSWYGFKLASVEKEWRMAPHEVLTREMIWPESDNDGVALPPGDYTVRAELIITNHDRPESAPGTIHLQPIQQ
jgi:hypothetical protein